MSDYRIYFMDGFTGHIDDVEAFHADNDDEAIARAKSKQGPSPMEVWSLHRKVARLEASGPGGFTMKRFLQAALAVQPEPLGKDDARFVALLGSIDEANSSSKGEESIHEKLMPRRFKPREPLEGIASKADKPTWPPQEASKVRQEPLQCLFADAGRAPPPHWTRRGVRSRSWRT